MINRFFQEEEGQTLVEYGLLISLLAVMGAIALKLLGNRIADTFNASISQFNTAST
jgi:pilus assembly protein Flp/PilA